jgi:hypothetical protein
MEGLSVTNKHLGQHGSPGGAEQGQDRPDHGQND